MSEATGAKLAQKVRGVLAARLGTLRARRDRALAAGAPTLAERLYRFSDRIAYVPFRGEIIDLPRPLTLDGQQVDIVADLSAYTGLPEAQLHELLLRRQALSFRTEWWATPAALRRDHWFYLSSKSYLFANAVHFPDTSFADRFVVPFVAPGGNVLDFGGGAGNLTLMLAGMGFHASYSDVNALQRDFVRFRIRQHGLEDRVAVADWWDEFPSGRFDAIVAVDVLEHLADASAEVERLLRSLKPEGVLVENSPFLMTTANPMHHQDFGLRALLRGREFELALENEDGTCVWKGIGGGA